MPEILDLTGPASAYTPPLSESLSPDGTTLINNDKPAETPEQMAKELDKEAPKEPPADAKPAEEAKPEVKDEPKVVDDEDEPDKTPPWMKAKITKAENRRRTAEKEAAESRALLSKMLDRLAAGQDQPKAKPQGAPTPDAYASPEEYAAAYIDWQVETRLGAALNKAEENRAAAAQQREAKARADAYQERMNKARAAHPDFDEKCFDPDLPINEATGLAIVESELGADIHYHLATHPEEAKAIYAMSPVSATRAVGRIEAILEQAAKAPKPEISRAPKPISPVGSSNAVAKSPENETMAEYEARRSRELYPERFKRAGL